jgi:hypothetical protein
MSQDLRPLVPRNATNGISLAEAHRDEIYSWFEEWSKQEGVEILLVKSPPFSPNVWVAVETWLPVGAPGMTKRSRIEIELVPRDFCRWPIELEIVLKESSRTRTFLGVVDFSKENAAALLRYLLGKSSQAEFGFKYCRGRVEARNKMETTIVGYQPAAVSPMQLALTALQFWRPSNRPVALKPDVVGRLPTVLWSFAAAGFVAGPFHLDGGGAFLFHLITGAIIAGVALYLLDVSAVRAWQYLSGGRAAAAAPANPSEAAGVEVAARRDVLGLVALTIMFALSLILVGVEAAIHSDSGSSSDFRAARSQGGSPSDSHLYVFAALAVVVGILNRNRRRLIWSSGRPQADPRIMLRMDSWQALLIGLGSERDSVHDAVVADLKANADASWSVAEERIWYWGVDGKEERQQTVVSFRSALAFLHFTAYGSDLYVAWDAHINRGTWTEKPVGRGTSVETGPLCEVHTIAPAHRPVSEYDVSDGNCVLERVHAVMTRVLRRKLAEHRLDQEIDFNIVREQRAGLTGEDRDEHREKPRLSLPGFRRKA